MGEVHGLDKRLDQIEVREGEVVNNARKCRGCRLPMYPSEGVEQLCPWCWPEREKLQLLMQLRPYDPLEESIL